MAKKPRPEGNGSNGVSNDSQTINIQGITFTAPAPYAEGHVVTQAEAVTLNQVYAENLRNNFAKRVKTAKDAAGEGELTAEQVEGLRQEFTTYAEGYQFHGKRSSRVIDPVEKETRKIARVALNERVRKSGKDLKSLPKEKIEDLLTQLIERNPAFREEAQRRVAAARDYGDVELDLGV